MSKLAPDHPHFGLCDCAPCRERARHWPEVHEATAWILRQLRVRHVHRPVVAPVRPRIVR